MRAVSAILAFSALAVVSAHPHPHPSTDLALSPSFNTSKQTVQFVQVGVGSNGLGFSPETIAASIGSLITFQFHGDGHTASEATARLRDPCNTEGGFDTGVENDGGEGSIIISTGNSIYVFCKPHCHLGEVMIVNPGPNDSVETFKQAAMGTSPQPPQSSPPPPPPPPPPSTQAPPPPPASSTGSPVISSSVSSSISRNFPPPPPLSGQTPSPIPTTRTLATPTPSPSVSPSPSPSPSSSSSSRAGPSLSLSFSSSTPGSSSFSSSAPLGSSSATSSSPAAQSSTTPSTTPSTTSGAKSLSHTLKLDLFGRGSMMLSLVGGVVLGVGLLGVV